MRKNRLNHNRDIMLGVMALAVVVLGVVVFFWMWCFPNGTATVVPSSAYRIVFAEGFAGDSVQLQLNDSVVFDGIARDSQEVFVKFPKEDCLLMVIRPSSDAVSSFNLSKEGADVCLRCDGDGVKMTLNDK